MLARLSIEKAPCNGAGLELFPAFVNNAVDVAVNRCPIPPEFAQLLVAGSYGRGELIGLSGKERIRRAQCERREEECFHGYADPYGQPLKYRLPVWILVFVNGSDPTCPHCYLDRCIRIHLRTAGRCSRSRL
jgi:hypothetical protein